MHMCVWACGKKSGQEVGDRVASSAKTRFLLLFTDVPLLWVASFFSNAWPCETSCAALVPPVYHWSLSISVQVVPRVLLPGKLLDRCTATFDVHSCRWVGNGMPSTFFAISLCLSNEFFFSIFQARKVARAATDGSMKSGSMQGLSGGPLNSANDQYCLLTTDAPPYNVKVIRSAGFVSLWIHHSISNAIPLISLLIFFLQFKVVAMLGILSYQRFKYLFGFVWMPYHFLPFSRCVCYVLVWFL